MWLLAMIFSAGLLWAMPVHADLYLWTEADGTIHVVDHRGSVPPAYQKGVKVYPEVRHPAAPASPARAEMDQNQENFAGPSEPVRPPEPVSEPPQIIVVETPPPIVIEVVQPVFVPVFFGGFGSTRFPHHDRHDPDKLTDHPPRFSDHPDRRPDKPDRVAPPRHPRIPDTPHAMVSPLPPTRTTLSPGAVPTTLLSGAPPASLGPSDPDDWNSSFRFTHD